MEDKFTVEKAAIEHLSQIKVLAAQENLSFWSDKDFIAEFDARTSIFLVAMDRDYPRNIIGFISARLIISENSTEIYNLAVDEEHKRIGVATFLWRAFHRNCLEQSIRAVWLEVRESNQGAISFYKKTGFRIVSRRKNFYANPPEDALNMSAELSVVPISTEDLSRISSLGGSNT